jgi:hypothetical protein
MKTDAALFGVPESSKAKNPVKCGLAFDMAAKLWIRIRTRRWNRYQN